MKKMNGMVPALLVPALLVLAGCGVAGYASVQNPTTPAAYREFLFRHPGHPRAARIRALLDKVDFKKAREEHTAPDDQLYLSQHP